MFSKGFDSTSKWAQFESGTAEMSLFAYCCNCIKTCISILILGMYLKRSKKLKLLLSDLSLLECSQIEVFDI